MRVSAQRFLMRADARSPDPLHIIERRPKPDRLYDRRSASLEPMRRAEQAVRLLAAWCELRKDFRSFRTDRVVNADYLDERYPERRDILRAKWRQSLVWERPKDT